MKFKEISSKIGTTEEAIALAEKHGFDTKLKVKHPFIKNKLIPVYIANFVLMEYGEGAILVVQHMINETSNLQKNII